MTWGPEYGGDSSAVQDQLKNVQQVQATYIRLSPPFSQMDLLFRGAIHVLVGTALQSKISSDMYSRSRRQAMHLLPSWQIVYLWLHGEIHVVETAPRSKDSSQMCSRFMSRHGHSLPAGQMDLLLYGYSDPVVDLTEVQE